MRLYRPHLERTNFFKMAIDCSEPFCFGALMLNQYHELTPLHILCPDTHRVFGGPLEHLTDKVEATWGWGDVGSPQNKLELPDHILLQPAIWKRVIDAVTLGDLHFAKSP